MALVILLFLFFVSPASAQWGGSGPFPDSLTVRDDGTLVEGTGKIIDLRDNISATYDSLTTTYHVTATGGGGSGDVTDVGDCATGACFTGTSGNTLTFKGATSGTTALKPTAIAGTTTITMPAETGTMCTTGSVCSGYQASLGYTPVNAADWTTINSYPAGCAANSFVNTIGDTLTCGTSISGNAATATALAANGGNCSAGSAPLGVDASGAVESCTDYEEDLSNSAGLLAALSDETGTGVAVFGTSPTIATPIITGKVDRNDVAVDDDDCTGEQGLYWYDTTDSAYEFCNANSGTPAVLGGGSGAPTTVDYLVGTADGTLSAEIVVGTSPGGELGGTWGTPTIDDTGVALTSLTVGALLGVDSIDATGAVDMDYGSADVTDHTFITDGTGDGEIVLPAGSISAAETVLTAGRSLTLSTNDILADAELYTKTFCYRLPASPVAGDDDKSIWINDTANGFTVTKLWCESDQTVTMMLQVDDGSPADMDSVDLVCISTPDTDTSLDGDATIAAGDRVDLDVASVSGTPTWAVVCWTGVWDD